jgi:N-acetylmuramic acid 6-phosphate (MurNAc-6-P) etherase
MTASRTQSITEMPNELTQDIDIATPREIVDLLCKSDAQIFQGWKSYQGLASTEIRKRIVEVVKRLEPLVRNGADRTIVISGAGTSGRLAMFAARTFNRLMADAGKPAIFRYLIAGGDRALIKAQEGAEDDPRQAVEDLKAVIGDTNQLAYFGITCGLSASYIAGQLDYALDRTDTLNVLLGFNPIALARNAPIEGWNKTFLDVARRVEADPRSVVLNPIVGPEPITGSTRMKGGSATKLLLEIILLLAILRTTDSLASNVILPELRASTSLSDLVDRLIDLYDQARRLLSSSRLQVRHCARKPTSTT